MKNTKTTNKQLKQNSLLFIVAAVAVVAMLIITQGGKQDKLTKDNKEVINVPTSIVANESAGVPATLNENGDVVIQIADITQKATFIDYDSNGTTIGLFAVKASDGTVRTALNTCQVCNGSPKAYFVQEDDAFQCQNCGNLFELDQIEQQRGGCNPVPIVSTDKTTTETEIIIPANLLDSVSDAFQNWKKS